MAVPSTLVRRRDHAREAPRPASGGQAVGGALLVVLVAACGACARVDSGAPNTEPPPAESIPIAASIPIDSAPARRLVDLDSLSAALLDRADTTSPAGRARLEAEIRDWLARLEFGDPELLPEDADPGTHFRPWRGRLLDALGWLAFRTGDLRQAEEDLMRTMVSGAPRSPWPGLDTTLHDLLARVLTDRQRRIIIYRYLDDLPLKSIAETMNLSTRTINYEIRKSLDLLRPHLDPGQEDS